MQSFIIYKDTLDHEEDIGHLLHCKKIGRLEEGVSISDLVGYWVKNHRSPNEIEQSSRWYHENKHKRGRFYNRAVSSNARARKLGHTERITSEDMEEVWLEYGGKCKKCGVDRNLVFDHISPYYKGGMNSKDNLQLLCRICNMEKGVG